MRIISFCIQVSLILLLLISCNKQEPHPPPVEVTVQLKWVHQAQFAGFYMAQQKGYYEEENLIVNFIEGGMEVNVMDSILSRKADFCVVAPELVIVERQTRMAPLTAIAAIYRRSAAVYVSREKSEIKRPSDFSGKSIAVLPLSDSSSEFIYQLKAMMNRLEISMSDMELVHYDAKYTDFLQGDVDVTAAYFTSGVNKLREKGLKLNIIWPGDYGIEPYSDTLVTTEEMINKQPEVVERFLKATLKGWRFALGNGDEAIEATLKYAKVKDFQYQMKMLNALRPLVDTGSDQIGWMTKQAWQQMHRILIDQEIIASPLQDVEKVYSTQFLDSIYGTVQP